MPNLLSFDTCTPVKPSPQARWWPHHHPESFLCPFANPPSYPTQPSSPGTHWPAFCHCRLVCIFSRLLYKWKHTECSIFLVWLFFAPQNYFEVCPHFWVLQKFIPFYCPAVFRGPVVPDFVDSIACWWTSGVPLLVAYGASLVAQLVKNLPAMWETWIWSLGWEDPWRRERLPTPVFWPGEFHALSSPWGHRVGHNWETFTSFTSLLLVAYNK